jgi:hypothetical protein
MVRKTKGLAVPAVPVASPSLSIKTGRSARRRIDDLPD